MSAMPETRTNPQQVPIWISAVVTVGAFLMIAGAVIAILRPAMLAAPHDEINNAVRVYAGYLFSRNLALGASLLIALGLRARTSLNMLLMLAAFTNFADAIVDCAEARWPVVPGVLVLAIAFAAASASLSGGAFWRVKSWRGAD
jgi:hypothetical protein